MIEYVLKKPYTCEFGTLHEGASMRVMTFNGAPVVFYEGGMVEGGYASILLNLITNKKLHDEYLYDREVIKDKV